MFPCNCVFCKCNYVFELREFANVWFQKMCFVNLRLCKYVFDFVNAYFRIGVFYKCM